MLEELENHLILNSNRLGTFEDARLEIVTYVKAKFGLRIRDSKPSDTGLREHSDPMDVGAANSLVRQRKRVHQVRAMGVFKCGGAHFSTRLQCKQEHQQAIVWQRQLEQVIGPRVSLHS